MENFVNQALVQSRNGSGPITSTLDQMSRLESGREPGNASRDPFIAAIGADALASRAQVVGERAEIVGEIRQLGLLELRDHVRERIGSQTVVESAKNPVI
jgi:hypothetical protein